MSSYEDLTFHDSCIIVSIMRVPESKMMDGESFLRARRKLAEAHRTVVFTNGCFDLLHTGHLDYLLFARRQGDALFIGVNSDASVRRNKGPSRPWVCAVERARLLAALELVDAVSIFEEDEPKRLIEALRPDVLVKGEDWSHYVSGREAVEQSGGRVVLAPLIPNRSTTRLMEKIAEQP